MKFTRNSFKCHIWSLGTWSSALVQDNSPEPTQTIRNRPTYAVGKVVRFDLSNIPMHLLGKEAAKGKAKFKLRYSFPSSALRGPSDEIVR